jgi:hypothetical protein
VGQAGCSLAPISSKAGPLLRKDARIVAAMAEAAGVKETADGAEAIGVCVPWRGRSA